MNGRKLRWGILGAANIARRNWKAIEQSGNSTITAVASRDVEKSRRFIAECQAEAPVENVPQAFGAYEDLIAGDAVDAIYIPLPTGLRTEWVLRAAAAGKHVVCEKPCAPRLADLRLMLDSCKSHGVQFMDGVMFMHSRRMLLLRQVLDDRQLTGEFRRIASAFTFRQAPDFFTRNIRVHSDLEPHGCLGDLGWYCIRFVLWTQSWQMPLHVTGRVLSEHRRPDSPSSVPIAFRGELLFADNVYADFYCSFITETEQWARISGTRGVVEVPDFVLPWAGTEVGFELHQTAFKVHGCDFRIEDQRRRFTVAEHSHGHQTAQDTNLYRNFADQVRSGKINVEWPEAALKTQIVMDACLESARAGGRETQPTRFEGY